MLNQSFLKTPQNILELIGKTPLLKVNSLSKLTGCEIYLKCEHLNPGGSIKDRAALQMVQDALANGQLKEGMTIVEGTAGNTGIGLAVVGRALGYQVLVVMPKGQAQEKERMPVLFGAQLKLVDPVPFANPQHFYHTARAIAEASPQEYFWANQFENLSNFRAHYQNTGPEIWEQTEGKIDVLVSVSGTGGTIGGTSTYLKEKNPQIKVTLIDPPGSGLCTFYKTGEFKTSGSSLTEGIGIMRHTANMKQAKLDEYYTIPDQLTVSLAHFVRDQDSILMGSSSALNLAGALMMALKYGPGKRIVTFLCDSGERASSKLYNSEYLKSMNLGPYKLTPEEMFKQLQNISS